MKNILKTSSQLSVANHLPIFLSFWRESGRHHKRCFVSSRPQGQPHPDPPEIPWPTTETVTHFSGTVTITCTSKKNMFHPLQRRYMSSAPAPTLFLSGSCPARGVANQASQLMLRPTMWLPVPGEFSDVHTKRPKTLKGVKNDFSYFLPFFSSDIIIMWPSLTVNILVFSRKTKKKLHAT